MKVYDAQQQAAIDAHGGYYLVLAPPGCGKTDILAQRIVEAHTLHDVTFDQMLCLTFTNRASRGMRHRVEEKVGEEAREVFVGNIHRYCSRYIFSNAIVAENTSIIDDDEQMDIMTTIDSKYFRGAATTVRYLVQAVDEVATYIKQTRLGHPQSVKMSSRMAIEAYKRAAQAEFDPQRLHPLRRSQADPETQALFALLYEDYKARRNIIDFSDMLVLAYDHMLHTPDHRRFPWIQVDEVQDLNSLQMAIIDLLTATDVEGHTVMYLGDEQQAIFSFMGAKLSILQMLKGRCEGHIMSLGNNYRSPQYLLNVCNDYAASELGVDRELLPQSLDKRPKERFDLILTSSPTVDMQYDRIAGMISHYLSLDDEGRLAILVTRNMDADNISQLLTAKGITHFKISGTDMFKSASYKTLTAFYTVLVNDFNYMGWVRLLYGMRAVPSLGLGRSLVGKLKAMMMTPSDLLSGPSGESYLQRFYKALTQGEMVVLDTETTGLNVLEDDVVQVAAYKLRCGRRVPGSEIDLLLHTDREIPEMLGDIPNPLLVRYATEPHLDRAEGLEHLIDYLGDLPIVGHNITFDYLILRHNIERDLGEQVDYDIYDSLHIIKCVHPGLKSYKLASLLTELGLEGQNSHLANEDIEATEALIHYCIGAMEPKLAQQAAFRQEAKTINVMARLDVLRPLIDNVRSYLFTPTSQLHRTIADELADMYQTLLKQQLIKDLGPKFDIFLRYIQSEWIDPERCESLYDQISAHIYDITASLNEGDLVNSESLLQDRVYIMTVYKGKGLEFDNVVVLDASKGHYPFWNVWYDHCHADQFKGPRREEHDQKYLEEARKFYVAISRAKRRLCVSYASSNGDAALTPFMDSIRHHFFEG